MPDHPIEQTILPTSAAPQGSVFLTGQICSREQRRGRYTPESLAHPGRMLPSIARLLIRTYTQIGDWVCDPMAGIATTVVEAMHLGRHGIGVEYEARWAAHLCGHTRPTDPSPTRPLRQTPRSEGRQSTTQWPRRGNGSDDAG
jgi:DNA methylase